MEIPPNEPTSEPPAEQPVSPEPSPEIPQPPTSEIPQEPFVPSEPSAPEPPPLPVSPDPFSEIPQPPTPEPASNPPPYQPAPSGPLTPEEERNWAMLSHLSVVINLFTGLLGPVVALIIYLVYKDRSRYVAFQSMQALIMQLVLWIGGGILATGLWIVTGVLSIVLIGLCLVPIALVVTFLPLAAIVYGIIGAVETNHGANFHYYLVGNWTESILRSNG